MYDIETRYKLIWDLFDEDTDIFKRLKRPWNIDLNSAESVARGKSELEHLLNALRYRMQFVDGDPDGTIDSIFSREFANVERYEGIEFAKAGLALDKCKCLLDLQFSYYCAYLDKIMSFPIVDIFEYETA